jgi:hypothetical protein
MPLFDTARHRELEVGPVVLRHELGHIVVWFWRGEAIGPLTISRYPDGSVGASSVLWPRCGDRRLLNSRKYAEPLAERLIAGESAARKAVGTLPKDQICTGGVIIDAKSCLPDILNQMDERSDIGNLLFIPQAHSIANWYDWVAVRLKNAVSIVDAHWAAIDQIARWLEPNLPQPGRETAMPGIDLIDLLRGCGVEPGRKPAVEVADKDVKAASKTRWKRVRRFFGCGGWTICRYVNGPIGRR